MSNATEVHDYLIHEGEIEGAQACALLWPDSSWPYGDHSRLSEVVSHGGFRDLLIESSDGSLVLKSMDKRLIKHIVQHGLHVIYKNQCGETLSCFIPAGQGKA